MLRAHRALLGGFEAVEKASEDVRLRLAVVRHVPPQVANTGVAAASRAASGVGLAGELEVEEEPILEAGP